MDYTTLFDKFSNKKVLIIGDSMVDSYLWGKVDRISPEAPIPVVSVIKKENRLGGAANVAKNIKSLGAIPILCSITGNDDAAKLFKNLLSNDDIITGGIIADETRATTVKTRVIGHNQHIVRIDEENTHNVDIKTEEALINKIQNFLNSEKIDSIIFQDYDKGCITKKIIETTVNTAKKLKIPTLVDPKYKNFFNYKGVTLFKPNYKEFTSGLKVDIKKDDFEKMLIHAEKFMSENNIESVLLTLSEKGVIIFNKKSYNHFSAMEIDIADVSGAGDTVIATASLCLASELSTFDTALISNFAGSIVCEKTGVVQIEKNELLDAIINYKTNKYEREK
ncbi:MAG: hypothetical protein A2046_03265 [Bacteroidetes bacterium GWA2_30_7]|nr:MAG: hypothetical protein A2046_03265 [Bacteroidetes bacterium GWA2_30_7]